PKAGSTPPNVLGSPQLRTLPSVITCFAPTPRRLRPPRFFATGSRTSVHVEPYRCAWSGPCGLRVQEVPHVGSNEKSCFHGACWYYPPTASIPFGLGHLAWVYAHR